MIMEVYNGGTLLNSGIAYDFSVKTNPSILTTAYTTPAPFAMSNAACSTG
jgi:hypothetical protein